MLLGVEDLACCKQDKGLDTGYLVLLGKLLLSGLFVCHWIGDT